MGGKEEQLKKKADFRAENSTKREWKRDLVKFSGLPPHVLFLVFTHIHGLLENPEKIPDVIFRTGNQTLRVDEGFAITDVVADYLQEQLRDLAIVNKETARLNIYPYPGKSHLKPHDDSFPVSQYDRIRKKKKARTRKGKKASLDGIESRVVVLLFGDYDVRFYCSLYDGDDYEDLFSVDGDPIAGYIGLGRVHGPPYNHEVLNVRAPTAVVVVNILHKKGTVDDFRDALAGHDWSSAGGQDERQEEINSEVLKSFIGKLRARATVIGVKKVNKVMTRAKSKVREEQAAAKREKKRKRV